MTTLHKVIEERPGKPDAVIGIHMSAEAAADHLASLLANPPTGLVAYRIVTEHHDPEER